jgi:hypothetical protein
MGRDLYFGLRHLKNFYQKREAIAAAERLARKRRVSFEKGQRRPPKRFRERAKFAAWGKRQQRVAARAAKRGLLL